MEMGTRKIVVVFECKNSGSTFKKELADSGYDVVSVCAGNDNDALLVLAKYNGAVNVVVVDLNTSKIRELEFLKKIRGLGYKYPVVVLSEYGNKLYPFGELDVYDIIEKPFNTSHLLDVVEDYQRVCSDLRREIRSTVEMLRELTKT